jgi:signal transduction histidine kinase
MFQSAVNKLTAWYVAALLIMVVLFSLPTFNFASTRLERASQRQGELFLRQPGGTPPPGGANSSVKEPEYGIERRVLIQEEQKNLLREIIITDALIVAAGAVLSYFFARHTLRPIQEAHEAQSRFTADASHELRTPLATMQAEIEVVLRDKKPDTKSLQNTLASNLEEIARLRGLSDQLLALTKVDTDALAKKQFSLSKAATKRIAELEKQYGIKISQDVKPNILLTGDEHLLTEIITILVDNAVTYSSNEPNITVSLKKAGDSILLSIADKGVGINPDEQKAIFERFYRGKNMTTHKAGHGLGLSLAQEIAKKSGGIISVTSKVGAGSAFTLELPKG